MDLNKVQIIWNLTANVELKKSQSWLSVTNVVVATNRIWLDSNKQKQHSTEYHSVVLWSNIADIAYQYLKKWSRVYIEWRIQTKVWEDQLNIKRYKTEIIWENLIMLWNSQWDWIPENINSFEKEPIKFNETKELKKINPKKEEYVSIDDIPF